MIIAIAGKGWMAVRAARLLAALIEVERLDATIEVVSNRDDTGTDTWLPSLVAVASARGWRVHDTPAQANLGAGDVFLSLQYDRIVRCADLGGAAAYNLHFAPLPRYRGSLTSSLTIRRGETQTGVTLHRLVQEVDAGPIIAARTFEVPEFYTAYDLYRAYHDFGFDLLKDNMSALLRGSVAATPQDDAAATAFNRTAIDFNDIQLDDFDLDAGRVRDWCRSLIFPPTQYPVYDGRLIRSCSVVDWDNGVSAVGTVLYKDPDQVVVKCRAGGVWLELLPPEQHSLPRVSLLGAQ
jgi:methionyl-tRNA formyltransferase